MAEFYRFPQWVVTALVMVTAVCIALQTLIVSFSFRRLPAGWGRRAENGMECAVLAALFLFAALLGQVQYGLYGGFLLPSAYGNTRQVVFLLCAVLATAAAVGTELIWPFFVIGGAAVLLPLTEVVTGTAYPFFFLAGILFFLLRSAHVCLIRRRELYTRLSSVSVKEAIDTLHTGLLFFRQSGEPLLSSPGSLSAVDWNSSGFWKMVNSRVAVSGRCWAISRYSASPMPPCGASLPTPFPSAAGPAFCSPLTM